LKENKNNANTRNNYFIIVDNTKLVDEFMIFYL